MIASINKVRRLGSVCILGLLSVQSQAANHYPVGSEGIKSATIPSSGQYYRNYNVLYKSDKLKDLTGSSLDNNFDLSVFASAHRYIYVTDHKILGGDFFWNLAIPIVYTSLEIGELNESSTRFGDIFIEPLGLAWHNDNSDWVAALAVYLPIGPDEKATDPGKGYYTYMFTGGGTHYFDTSKLYSFSITARYEVHSKQDNTDITPGDDFSIEWGLGKSDGLWEYGVSGYGRWQVTDDKDTLTPELEDLHDRALGIGPEVQRYFPASKILLNFKTHFEFNAVDSAEGVKTTLTFTKIF